MWKILEPYKEFIQFLKENPQYDIIIRELGNHEIDRIRKEYPSLQLFSDQKLNQVTSVTLISRIIQQKGYPKIKAYIDKKKKKIIHIFYTG